MYEGGMIDTYVVDNAESPMKENIKYYYTKLTEKKSMFVCPRANRRNIKDVGKIDLNTQDQ